MPLRARQTLCLRSTAMPGGGRLVRAPAGLPAEIRLRLGRQKVRVPVAYFWKRAISAGSFIHPTTGEPFTVTLSRMDRWIDKFKKMRRAGIEVPTPVDHSDRAEDNRGFVVDMRRNGDTLEVLHQAIGPKAAVLAARNRCSLYVEPEYVDANGHNWGEAVVHSAYTPKPVIQNHGPFVPFAASRAAGRLGTVPVYYFSRPANRRPKKETPMPLTRKQRDSVRRLLGLEEGVKFKESDVLPDLVRLAGQQGKILKKAGVAVKTKRRSNDQSLAGFKITSVPSAAKKRTDDEEDDEEPEEPEELDEDDTDLEDEDDDTSETQDDDAEDLDEDKDEDDADEEEVTDSDTSTRRTEKATRIAASRAVTDMPDKGTQLLLGRALRTERKQAIAKGGVTPEVAEALDRLFLSRKGRPNSLALSSVPGSDEPLAFEVYKMLQRNKRAPAADGDGRTGSQARMVLGRKRPLAKAREDREQQQLIERTAAWAKSLNKKQKRGKTQVRS